MRVVQITESGEFLYRDVDTEMLRRYPANVLKLQETGMEYVIFYAVTQQGRISDLNEVANTLIPNNIYGRQIPFGDAFVVGRVYDDYEDIYKYIEPDIQDVLALYADMYKECPKRTCTIL